MNSDYKKYCDQDGVSVNTALISVHNKTGIVEFAKRLISYGVKIISTGGTCQLLEKENIPVINISDITGFPEIMDGRVKTLHPNIYGALLCVRDNKDHIISMKEYGLEPIDLVVVNLYPFEESCNKDDYQQIVENIDIGGPSMIRAAAKNHAYVTVLTNPTDYSPFLDEIDSNNGKTFLDFRTKMASKAFARTASYDSTIYNWFSRSEKEDFPQYLNITAVKQQEMRYGENPHQKAALYSTIAGKRSGVANASLLQGKKLSYNNISDLDAACELVSEFHPDDCAACVIVKHANPCGVAIADTTVEAYLRALASDPVSAFGGIIAFNQILNQDTASEIIKIFTEAVIATNISKEAEIIISKKPNMRFLNISELPDPRVSEMMFKTVAGGLLVQTRDNIMADDQELKVVTKRFPTPQEISDMKFAFKVVKHVKSNAVVYAKEGRTVGIGAGQTSRVDSTRFAAIKSEGISINSGNHKITTHGSVIASEAFYPFPDGILSAIKSGVTAVIQPGGSVRDDEIIEIADHNDIAMVFTGIRHFRH
ncbi:bifunctional phosphoribosylaminoimidazolecarboxamide formyltransferase/IMP cyclohydrolase [Candidatus Liberibacter americanus]|uniref:Bifunctional purine biosynthesis protein PurH n=1 Tax=Candidatus Liberibacter americanus str. Sao Paulo TaxID=1261131 RepID=U6B3B7_9HYPH|nr:bifunctional phosphoribosylaminoimidazolecarboxamide formyltransferase/IMP cyclohydrolase [Candidatus Liberibacter americanus]AHA27415.1 AICAR transformylase/IMP cyclohydrolase PurH [Candidatus Liberibacter americanus str. Sao Paulo]EMS36688.1 bifunctional phosphoribosylaminoimidazolecarboxamide formyltransferase/IMP cyclohydrolase [Candidatus Liberibacter americanus PW_SP]